MGAHTDYGIVTVLWADRVPGLQVLGDDKTWHDVLPEPGALLVNLGDLMARWTNERWLSTLHRVKPPVVEGRIERRRSAAFFHDGNPAALIETIRPVSLPAKRRRIRRSRWAPTWPRSSAGRGRVWSTRPPSAKHPGCARPRPIPRNRLSPVRGRHSGRVRGGEAVIGSE